MTGLLLLLTGCAWIGPQELADRADFDEDGVESWQFGGQDCDDYDASVHPGAEEIWYDGVDQDCDGNDSDQDGDGEPGTQAGGPDCQDDDAAIHTGATEVCNGVDDDCDELTDDDDPHVQVDTTWYTDADGDGHGDADDPERYLRCVAHNERHVDQAGDCDDQDPARFEGNPELCDGIDNDCNNAVDDAPVEGTVYYDDADQDGFGSTAVLACTQEDRALYGGDCDDVDPTRFPGAPESCTAGLDTNCDGFVGETDHDGDGAVACEECDDGAIDVHPGAIELCNGVDDNCNGLYDDEDPSTPDSSKTAYYSDADGDLFGDPATLAFWCVPPGPRVSNGEDCDDGNDAISPLAPEVAANGIDEDCDGEDGCYEDGDADGFGSAVVIADADGDFDCSTGPGISELHTDCDDADPDVHPGAASEESGCLRDADGDGFGDANAAAPIGTGSDCDDNDELTRPGAAPADDPIACMRDRDADGYGDSSAVGGIIAGSDCDDDDEHTYVGAAEAEGAVCLRDRDGDGYGDAQAPSPIAAGTDCDDEDVDAFPGAAPEDGAACMRDADGDDYGDTSATAPVVAGTDCDDAESAIYLGAEEQIDNGRDEDCDGQDSCHVDDDADGFGGSGIQPDSDGDLSCLTGPKVAPAPDDCDDASAFTFPGAAPLDDDTACMRDVDGDGFGDLSTAAGVAAGTDCDDASADTFAGAAPADDPQACMKDADSDGYGDALSGGGVAAGTDCDDSSALAHPGVVYDLCGDGIDGDCTGGIDDCVASLGAADTLIDGADGLGEVLAAGPGLLAAGVPKASADAGAAYLFAGPLTGDTTPQEATRTWTGGTGASAGARMVAVDANGDGTTDLVVAAPGGDAVYAVLADTASGSLSSEADVVFAGTPDSRYGEALAAGLYTGDALPDLLIGAPYEDEVPVLNDRGSAVLLAGPLTASTTVAGFAGERSGQQLGRRAALFDYDGDGQLDVLLGALTASGDEELLGFDDPMGATFAGDAAWTLSAPSAGADFASIATGGDVNGDGHDDLLIGDPAADGGNGRAWLITTRRASSTSLDAADTVFTGLFFTGLGSSVALIEDLNQDGYDEILLIGPGGFTKKGAAYLFFGSPTLPASLSVNEAHLVFQGEGTDTLIGGALASGDLDGDGRTDLFIGAPGQGSGAGRISVFSGASF